MDTSEVLALLSRSLEPPTAIRLLANLYRPDPRSERAWSRYRRRRRVRLPHAEVAARLRLEAAIDRLGVGSPEFTAAVEAYLDGDTAAMDELRAGSPALAALVEALAGVETPTVPMSLLLELLSCDEPNAPACPAVPEPSYRSPQLRPFTTVLLRHGPTIVSRELLAA